MRVLGISGAFGHDAAAALVIDGQAVAACEEERFTRVKRASQHPAMHSVQACLDVAGIEWNEIDRIAIGWDPRLAPTDLRLTQSYSQFTGSYLLRDKVLPQIDFIPHHLAHAATSFLTSGMDEAAILVADGQSEDASTTIFHGQGDRIVPLRSFGIRDSLGFFYAATTRYLGFAPGGAGKTMGLATLGRPTYDFPEIALLPDGYRIDMAGTNKSERMAGWMEVFERVFGPPVGRRDRMHPVSGLLSREMIPVPHVRDAAASAQDALERTIAHLAETAVRLTGSPRLVLSGGVALNCSANGRLRASLPHIDLYINGAANDGGTALGAALALAAQLGELPSQASRWRSLMLGPRFCADKAIDTARRIGLSAVEHGDGIGAEVARRIVGDEVGAWFLGRPEYGPRALGARSILARADSRLVADRVNLIKGRENWRPLAPAALGSALEGCGLETSGLDFMVESRWIPSGVDSAPFAGVLHSDQSIRPLLVHEKHELFPVLRSLSRDYGHGSVVNTSFNIGQEPLVNSPIDALRSFSTSELDFVAMDGVLISKP